MGSPLGFVHSPKFRMAWALGDTIAILYICFLIPYRLTFNRDDDLLQGSGGYAVLDAMLYTFMLLGVVLQQIISPRVSPSDAYLKDAQTVYHSRKSKPGSKLYAILDVVSLVPVPYIAYGFRFYYPEIFYLFLLPHVFHIVEDASLINSYFNEYNIIRNVNTRRLIWLYIAYIVVIHIAACSFYLVGSLVLDATGRSTWIVFDGLAEFKDGKAIYLAPDSTIYIRAMYWAIVSLVTTGFGDIVPRTIPECIVSIFFFFLGYMGVCILIATVTNMVTIGSAAEGDYLKKMDKINEYMHYRQLPRELQDRIVSFYNYMWHLLKGVDVSEFINELPSSLRTQVAGLQTRNLLAKVVYFRNCNESLLNALVLALRQIVYSPGDEIVGARKVNKNLYLFTRGEAEMISRQGSVMKIFGLNKESFYGEWDIFKGQETENAIRARSFCELYVLTSEEFIKIREKYISEDDYSKMLEQLEKAGKQKKVLEKLLGEDFKFHDHLTYKGWKRIFLPDSTFRNYWSLMVLILVVWNVIIVPIRIAFFFFDQTNTFFLAVYVIDFIGDALYLIDIALRISFFSFMDNGLPNCDASAIRRQYFQNKMGVAADILGGFPWDLITFAFDSRASSFIRLAKLARLYHFGNDLAGLTKLIGAKISINHNIKQIITFLAFLLAIAHYFACFYLFLGWYLKFVALNNENWIDRDNSNPMFQIQHSEWSQFAGYIRSIYHVLLSITTVGYADIPPITNQETLYTAAIILIGGILYPAVVGASATFMNKLGGARKDFKRKMTNLRRYMEMKKFPPNLRKKIIQYYDYIWSRQQGVDELAVLRDLPTIMRSETAQHVVGRALRSIPFIEACEPDFVKQLYSKIEPATFLPDDFIINYDEIGSGLFILKYGMARVESAPIRQDRPDYLSQFERSLAASVDSDMEMSDPDPDADPDGDEEEGADVKEKVGESTSHSSQNSKDSVDNCGKYTVYRILYQGSFCGVNSLINIKSMVLIRAITFCDCYMVSKESVLSLLEEFPESKSSFLEEADDEHQKLVQMYKSIDKNMKKEKLDKLVDTHLSIDHVEISPTAFRHPDSMAKRYWQLLMLIITIYYIFSIPIKMLVLSTVDFYLYFFDWFLDIVMAVDFFLNLYYFGFMCEGQIKCNRHEITRNRLRQKSFYSDFMALIPWEIIAIILYSLGVDQHDIISVWIPILRFPKLLLCVHYSEYSDTLSRLLEEYPSIPEFFATIINLLLSVIIVSHIFASFLMFLGTYGTDLNYPVRECSKMYDKLDTSVLDKHRMNQYAACLYSGTWIQRQIETRHLPSGGGSDTLQYIRAFYWSISTLICVVMGDVNPINIAETAYVVLAMVVGVIINSGIIGGIANLVANLEGEEAVYSAKMDELENYLVAHEISSSLSQRVKRYMEYVRQSTGGFNDTLIINDLPSSLKNEVFQLKGYQFLFVCKIFRGMDVSFVRAVSLYLKTIIFSPLETIYNLHDPLHSIYFIVRGNIAIYNTIAQYHSHKASQILGSCDYFGEICVFCDERTTDMAQSVDFSECLKLDQKDLNVLIRSFNPDMEHLYHNLVKLNTFLLSSRTMRLNSSRKFWDDEELTCIEGDEGVEDNENDLAGGGQENAGDTAKKLVVPVYRTFSPRHPFTIVWETIGFFVIIYQFITIPFFLAYFDPELITQSSAYSFFVVVDTLAIVYWIGNSVLRMLFFSYLTEGVLVTDRPQIRRNYFRTTFLFDLLACFPYELFSIVWPQFYPFFRVPHLLIVCRYPSFFQKFSMTIISNFKSVKPNMVSIFNLFFLTVMFAHFCACAQFFIHRFVSYNEPLTWAIVDGLSAFNKTAGVNNVKHANVTFGDIYTRAFYYSMNIITTIGYGDLQPFSNAEIFYNIILAIVAASFQAAICGSIAAFLSQKDSTGEAAFNDRIHNIIGYMEFRQLPDALKQSILFYFSKMWEKERGCVRPRVINELPQKLQIQMSYAIYNDQMKLIDDLFSLDQRPREFISLKLKPYLCNMKEFIYRVGDIGDEIFFIVQGRVHLDSRDGSDSEDREKGESFGHEERGIDSVFRQRNARAETFCDLLLITRTDLMGAASLFPGIKEFPIFENLRSAANPNSKSIQDRAADTGHNEPLDLLRERLRRKMIYINEASTQRSRVMSGRSPRAKVPGELSGGAAGSAGNQSRSGTPVSLNLPRTISNSPGKIRSILKGAPKPLPGQIDIHLKPVRQGLSGLHQESSDQTNLMVAVDRSRHELPKRRSVQLLPVPMAVSSIRPNQSLLQMNTGDTAMNGVDPSSIIGVPSNEVSGGITPSSPLSMVRPRLTDFNSDPDMTPELYSLISYTVDAVVQRSLDDVLCDCVDAIIRSRTLEIHRDRYLEQLRDSVVGECVAAQIGCTFSELQDCLPSESCMYSLSDRNQQNAMTESTLMILREKLVDWFIDCAIDQLMEGDEDDEFMLDNRESQELRSSIIFDSKFPFPGRDASTISPPNSGSDAATILGTLRKRTPVFTMVNRYKKSFTGDLSAPLVIHHAPTRTVFPSTTSGNSPAPLSSADASKKQPHIRRSCVPGITISAAPFSMTGSTILSRNGVRSTLYHAPRNPSLSHSRAAPQWQGQLPSSSILNNSNSPSSPISQASQISAGGGSEGGGLRGSGFLIQRSPVSAAFPPNMKSRALSPMAFASYGARALAESNLPPDYTSSILGVVNDLTRDDDIDVTDELGDSDAMAEETL